MRSWHLRAIAGTCLFALLAVGTAGIAVPQPVRVVLGVPLVFLLSGFAVVCAVLPGQQLSRGERLLASLGASLVMTICVAVLLAATPVGLSRTAYAWFRARVPPARQPVASRPHDDRGLAPKKLWSDAGDRPKIVGYVADGEHDEAAIVADDADRLADEAAIVADGVDRLADEDEAAPEQVAFFDRANAQPRAVEQVLIRSALPGKVVGRVAFFERREVRNLLAYLRVISDPEDEASLRRVLNVPRRGIGGRTRECIAAIAEWDGMSFAAALAQPRDVPGLSSRAVRGIEAFNDLLAGLRADADAGMPVAEIAEAVLERSGYVAELEALGGAARVENLKELVTVAREFDALHEQAGPQDPETPGPAPGSLADFLAQVSLVADAEQPGGQGAEQ